jgi:hypothetical protein
VESNEGAYVNVPEQGPWYPDQYALQKSMAGALGRPIYRTVRQTLRDRIREHETILKELNELLVALDAIPDVERVLDGLRKVGL